MSSRTDAERHVWLLGMGAVPAGARSGREVEEACEAAATWWQVSQVTLPRLLRWCGSRHARHPALRNVHDIALAASLLGRLRTLLLKRVTHELEQRGIPYVALKGCALATAVYDRPYERIGVDLDLGVPYDRLDAFQEAAESLGFVPAEWNDDEHRFCVPDLAERAAAEADHYELAYLVRRQVVVDLSAREEATIRRALPRLHPQTWHVAPDGRLAAYLIVDAHHGLTHGIPVEPVVESACGAGTHFRLRVPAPEWMLFHLILKIYWEGVHKYGEGVYQYADLLRVLRRIGPEQARRFDELLERYALHAAAFYTLRRVRAFGARLPAVLARTVADARVPPPGADAIAMNDLGDMWPKLWGRR